AACTSGGSSRPSLLNGQAMADSAGSVSASGVSIFPNPSTGRYTVTLPADKIYSVRVMNIQGSQLLLRYASGSFTLDLAGRVKGVYIIELIPKDPTENVILEKLILQ
ncbi:MAG TPA: T9SS type A sorting domain-containing protein, partial [Puia sp.]|nr:T9SS type A sorting domain-containing protein [Puia sp.]